MTNSFGSHEENGWSQGGMGERGVEVVLIKKSRVDKEMEMERVIGNERVMDEKKGMREVWRKQDILGEKGLDREEEEERERGGVMQNKGAV